MDMVKTSGAESSFVHSINSPSTGDENIDVPAEDLKTKQKDMARRTRAEVETVNFVRVMSAASGNFANKAVPAQNFQTQPDNTMTPSGTTTSFVKNVYTFFDKDENMDVPICIFKVPNSIASSKPEAYVPQLVGLGPYHHLRPELQQMQTYKLTEVKNIGKEFRRAEFQRLVSVLEENVVPSARACYDTYLNMDDEVLACIIAIDGLFLIELLCCCGISRDVLSQSDLLRDLVNSAGRRLAWDTTLRDAMMVENQVPIHAWKVILITLEMIASLPAGMEPLSRIVSDLFPRILLGFCQALSPLKVLIDYPQYKVLKHSHLLDLMYHLIILKDSPKRIPDEEQEEARVIEGIFEKVEKKVKTLYVSSELPLLCDSEIEETLGLFPEEFEKPIKLLLGLHGLQWSKIWSTISSATEAPPVEEILIPSASELHKAGVKFMVADHITSIRFELNTLRLYLPLIKLDVNSEVIIRNLVAYEAMIKSESDALILTRYVELMKGLVESAEDVKVLKGVIQSKSIKEDEVAKMFSGMNSSVRITNTHDLDDAIAEVNRFYNGLWMVSVAKFVKKWQRTAWNFCKVFAALLFLLLMAIQTFCSVYECPRLSFKSNNSQAAQQGLRVLSFRSYV